MEIEKLKQHFEKVSIQIGFSYSLEKGADKIQIRAAETRLGMTLPKQVGTFYSHFNGLRVNNPRLEILALDKLSFYTTNKLHFAIFDNDHNIYFDVSETNLANQWDIVSENNYLITRTMASFWSNKIWRWLKYRKEIWIEEFMEI